MREVKDLDLSVQKCSRCLKIIKRKAENDVRSIAACYTMAIKDLPHYG